jgi:type IV secretory pathway VirD2 relaxase
VRKARLTKEGEVDIKLRRRAAWLEKLPKLVGRKARTGSTVMPRQERTYGRKSIVKIAFQHNFDGSKWNGKLGDYSRYIERGHQKETGHREVGFDATEDAVDTVAVANKWALARDKLHWRIILTPDDVDRIDLRQHVCDVMAQMEKDLGTKLQWVAVEHDNTEHRHAHILLRGVRQELNRDGKCITLTMPREYQSQGIRYVSQELVERQLGPRSEREYLDTRSHGVEAERWTEIDRAIEKRLDGEFVDYRFAAYLIERSQERVQQEIERMAYLEGRGFAYSTGDHQWMLVPEWKDRLKEMQIEKDVIRSHARTHARQREGEREIA